jgi:TonB family protein
MRLDLVVAMLCAIAGQNPQTTPTAEPGASSTQARTPDGRKIIEPKKLKSPSPKWPDRALRAGLTGTAVLEAVINTKGDVDSVKPIGGPRSLGESAAAAVRKWKYTVTLLDGTPVPVLMTVTVNFRLEQPPTREDVLQSVDDSDPEIRWAAVRWLGRYRPITREQRAAIEEAIKDPIELVRTAALESLAKLEER